MVKGPESSKVEQFSTLFDAKSLLIQLQNPRKLKSKISAIDGIYV